MSRPSLSTSSWRTGRAPIRSILRATLCLSLALLPRLAHAQAQATTGIIRGSVRDSAGTPIPNATITARNVATNFTRPVTTNSQGSYAIPLLPLGTYEVTARVLGFAPAR